MTENFAESFLGQPWPDYLQEHVVGNEMFLGLAFSGLLFSLLYLLRKLPQWLFAQVYRQFVNELELESWNDYYTHVLSYLTDHGYIRGHTRRLYLDERLPFITPSSGSRTWLKESGLVFGQGWHVARFGGRPLFIQHIFKEQSETTGNRPRLLRLCIPGRHNKPMIEFIRRVTEHVRDHQINKVPIYYWDGQQWSLRRYRSKRRIDSLVLDTSLKTELLEEIRWFYEAPEWYDERGIPYRRSYLIHGPPGTGKTSTAFTFTGYFSARLYTLNLSTLSNDGELHMAFSMIPEGAFLLLEDIDASHIDVERRSGPVTDDHSEAEQHPRQIGITLSGLLNALDGISSPTGVVVMMTTNHPEKLDPALMRPGRVDRKIYLGYPDASQAKQIFTNFYTTSTTLKERFAKAFMEQQRYQTTADLQELLIEHPSSPQRAVEAMETARASVQAA